MTHDQLRKIAMRWLKSHEKCTVILSELVSAAFEIPDAIGWKFGHSVLVECKTSRADFLANAKKSHEQAGHAVGCRRFFMCPPGMIEAEDPLFQGDMYNWGLLWVEDSGRVLVKRGATQRYTNEQQEIRMLTSALRRIQTRDFIMIVPAPEMEAAGTEGGK